jgi:hypothetical protein
MSKAKPLQATRLCMCCIPTVPSTIWSRRIAMSVICYERNDESDVWHCIKARHVLERKMKL